MEPIVLGMIAAGTAMIAVAKFSKDKSAVLALTTSNELAAKQLEKDKAYTVRLVTRSENLKSAIKKQFGPGTMTAATASNIIKAAFQQLGWNVMSEPVLAPGEATNWDEGKPAFWVFTGRWLLDDKNMGVDPNKPLPEWYGGVEAYKLPVT